MVPSRWYPSYQAHLERDLAKPYEPHVAAPQVVPLLLVSEGKDASSCVRVRRDARGKKGVQSRHSDPPILLAVGAATGES